MLKGGTSGLPALVPGDPVRSRLVVAVTHRKSGEIMTMHVQPPWPVPLLAWMAFGLAGLWGPPTTFAAESQADGSQRPNMVFLLADDLRWNTLGCMGDRIIQTPNIDAL